VVRYALRLCVAGHAPNSVRAIVNVKRLLEGVPTDAYSLEIIDVLKSPQAAYEDKVLAAPTLIRLSPAPSRRVVDDMSDPERTASGLDLPNGAGNRPPAEFRR
jgi:circadian clock protein KaiB